MLPILTNYCNSVTNYGSNAALDEASSSPLSRLKDEFMHIDDVLTMFSFPQAECSSKMGCVFPRHKWIAL